MPERQRSRWKDGINPYVEDEKREAIVQNRIRRAEELERRQEGAGVAYLAALGLDKDGRYTPDEE